jgi:hypothetical protein
MEDVLWSLVSLTVAGTALAVIAVPTVIGTGRALRAIKRRREASGRSVQPACYDAATATMHPSPAAVAVAVPMRPVSASADQLGVITEVSLSPALRHLFAAETTTGTPVSPVTPTMPGFRPMPDTLPALTPLERALWQAHERLGVSARVQAEWDAGPELVPGVYPLAEGLLSPLQVAELTMQLRRRGAGIGCGSPLTASAVTAARALHPTSNAWN